MSVLGGFLCRKSAFQGIEPPTDSRTPKRQLEAFCAVNTGISGFDSTTWPIGREPKSGVSDGSNHRFSVERGIRATPRDGHLKRENRLRAAVSPSVPDCGPAGGSRRQLGPPTRRDVHRHREAILRVKPGLFGVSRHRIARYRAGASVSDCASILRVGEPPVGAAQEVAVPSAGHGFGSGQAGPGGGRWRGRACADAGRTEGAFAERAVCSARGAPGA